MLDGDPVSWEQAQLAASSSTYGGLSGHLVTVTSLAEHEFIKSQWASSFNHTGFTNATWGWIGLSDHDTEGSFEWVTREDLGFTAWHHLEPNNLANSEDYVHYWLAVDDGTFSWNDSSSPAANAGNGLEVGYFVEFESPPVPEPSTAVIFSGLAVCISVFRRRRDSHS